MPNTHTGEIDPTQRTWVAQSHRSNELGNPIHKETHLLIILYYIIIILYYTYYRSSDNKKISDLDFGIIKGIPKDFCRTESCLKLSLDHSLVIFSINSKIMYWSND